MKCFRLLAFVCLILLSSGCQKLISSVQPESTAVCPQLTPAEKKVSPPTAASYEGWSIHVKLFDSSEAVLMESTAVAMVLDAWNTPSLVSTADATFRNSFTIVDSSGQTRYHFLCASDGQYLFKDDTGVIFQAPQYVMVLLENRLCEENRTLLETPFTWQPDKGTGIMELRLPYLINSVKVSSWGYAQAYFNTYKIYTMKVEDSGFLAKIYALVAFSGYDIHEAQFSPSFLDIRPVCIEFRLQKNGQWRLINWREADKTDGSYTFTEIRKVIPYEYAESVQKDLADPSAMIADMKRQALNYLRSRQAGSIAVGDWK